MSSQAEKEKLLNQKAVVIWLTGLPCSGKTTLAKKLEHDLFKKGFLIKLLDGDKVRHGLNKDLGFTIPDREENIRRIAEISKLFIQCGVICINSFISPTHKIRKLAKEIIGPENFIEIFVNTPIEICEKRDVKGMYEKAKMGLIKNFTGIDAPYENPVQPDIIVDTELLSLDEAAEKCVDLISSRIKLK